MRHRAVGLLVAVVVIATVASAHGGSGIGPRPICTFSGTALTVDPQGWDVTVVPRGPGIEVRFAKGPVDCPGEPTVFNVDLVRVTQSAVTFDLREQRLEPGFTDEGDGSSEIEIKLASRLGPEPTFRLANRADVVRVGALGAGRTGINLNGHEPNPDVDVSFGHSRYATVRVHGGAGADRITANGGTEFSEQTHGPLIEFYGQAGADRLIGSPHTDVLFAGRGADALRGLDGSDGLVARGGGSDIVRCGRGEFDQATADRGDLVRACEF